MFKLDLKESYTWPVEVKVPVDGGRFDKMTFDAEFKRLSRTEIEDILTRNKAAAEAQDVQALNDMLDGLLVGWKGVVDQVGQPVPFSESTKHMVLDINPVRNCVFGAWLESISAGPRKN